MIGWFWLTGGRYVSTDNAYVQADTINIATDVAGLVKSIQVHDNEHVTAGQVLFTLDDSTYRSALASADAEVRMAATSSRPAGELRPERCGIVKAKSDVAYYEKEYRAADRPRDPPRQCRGRSSTRPATTSTRRAASWRRCEQQQAGIAAQLGGDPAAPIERHPRYLAAVAARDRAQHDLDHTVVRAPIDGMTARVPSLQPGEYLDAGQAAFALVASDHVWIEANPRRPT